MSADEKPVSPERTQTDESLRLERQRTDSALTDELAALQDTADAVIERARVRADQVLAAARARADELRSQRLPSDGTARMRALEDQTLRDERADADETRRDERAELGAVLARDRRETDDDLSSERAHSDDALATRDEFLGIVGHDLRNMLHAMIGFAGLIAKEVEREGQREQVVTHAQRIQRSGARMNRLIGDLLDVASIDAGGLAVTRELGDPSEVVTEAVDTLHLQAGANGISLTAAITPPLRPATFDAARILQVLVNLVTNALKFTPAGGKVVVQVEGSAEETLFVVSDTGIGIPSDRLESVFERFIQVNAPDRRGVGLGLYISKCIVQGHGGRIWAESTVGQGSRFSFTIPAVATR